MPEFKDHVPTIQVLLLVNEIGQRQVLLLVNDQIEILIEEIDTYCTPDSISTAQIRLSTLLRKLLTALVFQYLSFLHNYLILWLITIQTI